MRCRFTALLMTVVLLPMSAINMPAAPLPAPTSAVLDIGSQRKGNTAEEHRKQVIRGLSNDRHGFLWDVKYDAEVKKLRSVARLKNEEVGPWLEKNIRAKEESDGRRLRLTFQAGSRAEQVVILNALLRAYMRSQEGTIKSHAEILHTFEEYAAQCVRNSKQYPTEREIWQKREAGTKADMVPIQAEINRLKQVAVIKWAK